jgi:hypothetical protein
LVAVLFLRPIASLNLKNKGSQMERCSYMDYWNLQHEKNFSSFLLDSPFVIPFVINQIKKIPKKIRKKVPEYLSDKKKALPLHPLSGKPASQPQDL